MPSHYSVWITQLRTSNLRLPMEVGRWYGIPKENRHCTLCLKNIGDEFHVLFKCENDVISDFRNNFIPSYYCKNPNVQKMEGMFSNCHIKLLTNVAISIKKICKLLQHCILCSLCYMLYYCILCSLSNQIKSNQIK